ncbi:MAG: amidohydrolase family protein [Bacteroidota bacterium]|nr:amidohydrolase family protein [Bacteroidota bacterium]
MQYRKFKADSIFDGKQFLYNKVVLVKEDNSIEAIVSKEEAGEGVLEYSGILIPGLINCHCHLELSYLKNIVPPYTGLVNFLMAVVKNRTIIPNNHGELISGAEKEMSENGIVGVADICNTADAISAKKNSNIRWHNLIEVINFNDDHLEERLMKYKKIAEEHKQNGLKNILTPHAPYSVSKATHSAINILTSGAIISIHNQETAAENELFQNGSGDFLNLYETFGNRVSPFEISGKTSLQTWLPHFTNGQTILSVHNTFIEEGDILFAKKHATQYGLNFTYCLCPNANLYIENALPPIDLLIKHECKIVLGTDSYSSNWQLNIISEIETIKKYFPYISLHTILQWATSNAAEAMQWEDLGSFEKDKKPGIIHLKEKALGGFEVKRIL